MPVIINWGSINKSNDLVTGHEIYRSLNKLDVYSSGNLLASVGPDDATYTDTTALSNTPYHYGVRVLFDGGSLDSRVRCLAFVPDIGVGSGSLLAGDYEAGTMGMHSLGLYLEASVYLKDYLTSTGLYGQIISFIAPTKANNDYKLMFNAKVCYLPNDYILQITHNGGALGAANGRLIGAAFLDIANHLRDNVVSFEGGGRTYRLCVGDFEFARNFMHAGKMSKNLINPSEKRFITLFSDFAGRPNYSSKQILHHYGMGDDTEYKVSLLNISGLTLDREKEPTDAMLIDTLTPRQSACLYFELMP